MLAILSLILLSAQISKAAQNYCSFNYKEKIGIKSTISDSSENYFYFDVEGYSKKSFSNLSKQKSETFSIQEDFGDLIKISSTGTESVYSAYSISFHIPPEHYYEITADLEIMIHHSDSDGNNLVLCYLFSNSTGEENSSRRFFSSLNDAINGNSNIDPTDLSGGYYHIKEFFYADSTQSSTLCSNSNWAIYSDVLYMKNSDLEKIKKNLVTENSQERITNVAEYTQYTGSQVEFGYMLMAGLAYLLV